MNDTSFMPFGKHIDKRMADVPDDYLDWLIGQEWIHNWPEVRAYIVKNKDAIDQDIDERNQMQGDDIY